MNKRTLTWLVLLSLLLLSNLSSMHSILLIIFTVLPHISVCVLWAFSAVRCRFLMRFFLGLSGFASGGLASYGRSASPSFSELSSSRHAAWLNFADFRSSGEHFFAYRILLSTIICDIASRLYLSWQSAV